MTDFEPFLPQYTRYLEDAYKLPHMWSEKCGLTILASVLNQNVWMKTFRGFNRLNLWNSVVGPSGIGKSIVMQNEIAPILSYVSKRTDQNLILPSTSTSFEGLTDIAIEGGLRGLIIRDEMTTLLKEGKIGYTSTVPETYSLMYDGWIMPRATRQVKVKKLISVYVNLIGGTTPKYLFTQMKPEFFFQGIGNRIDYEYPDIDDWVIPDMSDEQAFPNTCAEDLFSFKEEFGVDNEETFTHEQRNFADMLVVLADATKRLDHIILEVDVDAKAESNRYRAKTEEEKKNIPRGSKLASESDYLSRNWQKSLKYAGLYALSDVINSRIPAMSDGSCTIFVSLENIIAGQEMVDHNMLQFRKLMNDWLGFMITEESVMKTDDKKALRYLAVIKEWTKTNESISQKRLAFEVGNVSRNKEFGALISYLAETGCIKILSHSTVPNFVARIKAKDDEWFNTQMINRDFRGTPPVLYQFIKDLTFDLS